MLLRLIFPVIVAPTCFDTNQNEVRGNIYVMVRNAVAKLLNSLRFIFRGGINMLELRKQNHKKHDKLLISLKKRIPKVQQTFRTKIQADIAAFCHQFNCF
ncbi:hypothetical protein C7N83_13945 [Neisseria iguanae]|uniref:Uncharacterized protein n=1 Tax=Neisseria iguanae TaxID=90242 RepID=A0A2P7TWU6_9NEIS|nr:hypothetical protein C7N83_13945 [Neisseria iguanae]